MFDYPGLLLLRFCLILHIYRIPHPVSPQMSSDLYDVSNRCDDAKTDPGHPERILYNKVPKCGSTTMQLILDEVGELTGMTVTLQQVHRGMNLEEEQQREFVEQISSLASGTLLHRHIFLPDFHRFGAEYPALFNLIRDPVSRTISSYYYIRELSDFRDEIPDSLRYMDLDECIERREKECMVSGGAIGYFCGQDRVCRQHGPEALERAKYNVCQYYDTVGIMEDMRSFVEVLEHLYPDYMSGIVDIYDRSVKELHHQTSTKSRREPSSANLEVLKEALHDEYEFYYFIKDRFYRQYETIKNTF